MKFLAGRSLKQLGLYSLLLMIFIFILEFFGVRHSIHSLEEAERKIDFARSIQIGVQQIGLQSQLHLEGNAQLASQISTKLEQQNHQLKVLAQGGRIDGTPFFIQPLSRLPKITYDNLFESWENYKESLEGSIIQANTAVVAPPSDTSGVNAGMKVPVATNVLQEAKWLSLSDWFTKLIHDLEEEVTNKQQAILGWLAIFIAFDIALLAFLYYGFNKLVIRPVQGLEANIFDHKHTDERSKNEIGKVTHQINEIIENLKDATDFVISIGEGKLDIDYKETLDPQYVPGKNKLADSLIQMQEKLKALNETERRRQWATEGLTKFVEIMRSSNDNLSSLGDAVISALVQYTRSNQGGLYILNDEDPNNKYLELISLFAFDSKKYEQQKVKLGEGILGQTFLEKETTHLTNMPEEYIRITSGLGEANPRALLLFPLKVDKEAYGIIELASFHEYQQHEIEFVEKLGESIAATLASVRGTQKNRQLIEQFQQQTEEMRAQEEEMRQNMEELQATQEEVARKEQAYLQRIKELENSVNNSGSSDLEAIREHAEKVERELRRQVEELNARLSNGPKAEDWAVAEDVERTLKMNLEAIKITQEELDRKARH
ncbi:MAG TPA: GAF domain-containing protein [Chryseolinea sp.]|nr:GAF domain-containing protein [Chryseolinea sp.]